MNNEIQTFVNNEFGHVRTIMIDNKAYFCGVDIANRLGYKKPNNAISRHCRYALKWGIPHPQSKNKTIEMIFIPIEDVTRLITKSQLKDAQKFESWIFDEVLPTLLKTGAYFTPGREEEAINTYFPSFSDQTKLLMITDLQNQNKLLHSKNQSLISTNKALATGILEWSDRTNLNAAVRKLAGAAHKPVGIIWRQLYRQLLYKHHISLKARGERGSNGKTPLLQYVKEEEWPLLIQSFSAICEAYEVSVSDMFTELKVG